MGRVRLLLAVMCIGMASLVVACEKSNDVVASDQLRESQNVCAAGCLSPVPGCTVKGNISATGKKYYHTTDEEGYAQIYITPQKGERWFCTEAEALANGWVKKAQ